MISFLPGKPVTHVLGLESGLSCGSLPHPFFFFFSLIFIFRSYSELLSGNEIMVSLEISSVFLRDDGKNFNKITCNT